MESKDEIVIDYGKAIQVDVLANDANIAALGEMWQGAGKGYENLVMITLGTGVGGGIILNQQILPGVKGVAGEIGHMHVNPNETVRCNCGGCGCVDQIASATGIVRFATRELEADTAPSTLRDLASFTAKDVVYATAQIKFNLT